MSNLEQTQSLFWSILRGDPDVAVERVRAEFAGSDALPPEARVEIYREMVEFRMIDALREDFPKLVALLGDEAFYHLGEAYLRAFPSEDPNLGKFGRALAPYLRQTAGANGQRPDLGDLAELEWTRNLIFEGAEAESVGQEALATLGPEAMIAARLRLIPALGVIRLDHDVAPLWRAIEEQEAIPPPHPEPAVIAVWRQGFEVYHAALVADEAMALRIAIEGGPLGEICDAFADREAPVQAAFTTLGSWFADGWIRAVEVRTMEDD